MSGGQANYEAFKRIQNESGSGMNKPWSGLTHVQRMAFEAGAQAAVALLLPNGNTFSTDDADADTQSSLPLGGIDA